MLNAVQQAHADLYLTLTPEGEIESVSIPRQGWSTVEKRIVRGFVHFFSPSGESCIPLEDERGYGIAYATALADIAERVARVIPRADAEEFARMVMHAMRPAA